jgi:hypothetical protein
MVELESQSLGTQFEANKAVQDTLGYHLAGSRWMTFTNTLSKVVHWDLVSCPIVINVDVLTFYPECYRKIRRLPGCRCHVGLAVTYERFCLTTRIAAPRPVSK